ncbi:hypothetical protein [Bifidobacterium gallicum]|nr:hypothetical protein [Bifidobacterium gallicum]KFI58608.1 membrane protein [Bifidobacterium gallicum DSM 20093 = LMG 11596]
MRALNHCGVWITEAAISGVPMIPLFIFVTSFIAHEGEFTYVLPFVLFYAFNKMGEFTLGMFGEVNNPYRLAQISAWIVIVGALVCWFGHLSIICYDIAGVLIGFGSSIFGTMYRTVKSELLKAGTFPYPHANLMGFALMTVFSFAILAAQGRLETIIISVYIIMAVIALLTLQSFDLSDTMKNRSLFQPHTGDMRYGIPALLMLLIAFFVRLFKQTAGAADIIIVMVLVAIILVVVNQCKRYLPAQAFNYHGMYYNEVLIMVVLFNVFYYIASNNIPGVLIINGLQFLGQFLAMLGASALIRKLGSHNIPRLITLAMIIALIVFAIPNTITDCIAVFAIGFLSQTGDAMVSGTFRHQSQLTDVDQALSSQKTIGTGIVAGQTILVIVLAMVSLAVLHNDALAMSAYAFHISINHVDTAFMITRWICSAIIAIQGIIMAIRNHGTGIAEPRVLGTQSR